MKKKLLRYIVSFGMFALVMLVVATAKLNLEKKEQCDFIGKASWYGRGSVTASGEKFRPQRLTAAHPDLGFGTRLKIINLRNHQSVVVEINDRGPYVKGRIIDLSKEAARRLSMLKSGIEKVCIIKLEQSG